MRVWDNIKKQIDEQTRGELGHVPNMRLQGFNPKPQQGQEDEGYPIWVMWRRLSYNFDRGTIKVHTPASFLQYHGPRHTWRYYSDRWGEFVDSNVNLHDNYHYATKVKTTRNRFVTVNLNIVNCSFSLYLREEGGDYQLIASQEVASPSNVTLSLRANVWTEIHLFTYHGFQDDIVRCFNGLTSAISQAGDVDIYPPSTPTWRSPYITTSLLDPTTGQSEVTLFWDLPTDTDWAGNSIYRVETYTEHDIFSVPSGLPTPPEFASKANISIVTVSGDQAAYYLPGSTITVTGNECTVVKTVLQPANLFPNNDFSLANSGYPQDWQVNLYNGTTFTLGAGGQYGTQKARVVVPTGAVTASYMATSGYIPVDATKVYFVSIASNPVTLNRRGTLRLQFYQSDYSTTPADKVDFELGNIVSGWQDYNFSIGPSTVEDLNGIFASGCAYVIPTIYFTDSPASGFEGSYSAVRIAQESTFGNYGSEGVDTTRIFMDGVISDPIASGTPVDRRYFQHVFDRIRRPSDDERGWIYYVDTAVRHGRTYTYVIDTYDSAGNHSDPTIERSIVAGDTDPPAHVTQIRVTRTNGRSGSISWLNPLDEDFASTVVCTGMGYEQVAVVPGQIGQRSYFVFNNLTPGETLQVNLFAQDRNGNVNAAEPVPSGIIPASWESDEQIFAINMDKEWYNAGSNYVINILSQVAVSANTPTLSIIDSARSDIIKDGSLSKSDDYKWTAQFNVSGTGPGTAAEGVAHVIADMLTDNGKHIQAHTTFGIDYTQPVISSFTIDSDNGNVYQNRVLVSITASDETSGLYDMMVSEDPTFAGAAYMPYANQYFYTFSGSQAGNRTLFCRVRDRALNVSAVTSDTVYFNPAGQQNYILNGSFEYATISTGIPDGMAWHQGGGGFGPYIYSTADAPFGGKTINAHDEWYFFWPKVYLPPYSSNRSFTLSWYSQSESAYPVRFKMDFYDSSDRQVGSQLIKGNGLNGVPANTKDWDRFSVSISAADMVPYATASYMKIAVRTDIAHGEINEPMVDAVQLQAGSLTNFYEALGDSVGDIGPGTLRGFQIGSNEVGPTQIAGAAPSVGEGRSFFNAGELEYIDPADGSYLPLPYIKGVRYIAPQDLICGTRQYFSDLGIGSFSKTPQVVIIPARVMTYNSGIGNVNMFLDLSNYEVTPYYLKVNSVLRYGTSNLEYTQTVLSGSPLISGLDTTVTYSTTAPMTKGTADVLVFSDPAWTRTTKLQVQYQFTAPSVVDATHPSGYPCTMDFCLLAHPARNASEWPASPNANTTSGFQSISFYTNGQVYTGYLEIERLTPGYYGVKVDWYGRSPDVSARFPSIVYITKVRHIAEGNGIEITGSGICGALIFAT